MSPLSRRRSRRRHRPGYKPRRGESARRGSRPARRAPPARRGRRQPPSRPASTRGGRLQRTASVAVVRHQPLFSFLSSAISLPTQQSYPQASPTRITPCEIHPGDLLQEVRALLADSPERSLLSQRLSPGLPTCAVLVIPITIPLM